MKAMKSRMLGITRRSSSNGHSPDVDIEGDTPEANAVRCVRLFCEAGNPTQSGEEVVYLPTIIESAESSPTAARECANVIRKYLSKDSASKPFLQYNAVMLIRILADNPGPTFTRNIDAKFVAAVKELLRSGKDLSVKQLLIETLQNFDRKKKDDETLAPLLEMFKKEQDRWAKAFGQNTANARGGNMVAFDPSGINYFSRPQHRSSSRTLPSPGELSSRVEEARTSAGLLTQLVQSTSATEFFDNDLIKEFHQRCTKASRSMQNYMAAEQPPPDNDTMLTLIETNEVLTEALSKYSRAVLDVRKQLGITSPGPNSPAETAGAPAASNSVYAPPPGPPPTVSKKPVAAAAAAPAESENPFSDPANGRDSLSDEEETAARPGGLSQPYHPGFRPTQSYTQRQESGTGNLTMRGANPEVSPVEEDEEEYHAAGNTKGFRY